MTDRYAVIGHPISHSKSPLIHSLFAQATGQDLEYTAIEGHPGAFAQDLAAFQHAGGKGLNITLPFKVDAFACATHPSDRARIAGAVNAIKFDGDRVLADNFDGVGLMRDVEHNLGIPIRNKRVLILGAGGATRGLIEPLMACQPAQVWIANRTLSNAVALANDLAGVGHINTSTFADVDGPFDIVFNATSASLTGEAPPLPPQAFGSGALAYDLVYGKGLTPFLKFAQQACPDVVVADGVGMLVEQAAEAFAWWRGVRPGTAEVIQRLTVPLV